MLPAILAFVAALASLATSLPSPDDKHGWGLRLRAFSVQGPYLVGEDIGPIRFEAKLINFSNERRVHDPLIVARAIGDLHLTISQPDGRRAPTWLVGRPLPRDPFTEQHKLRAGESYSEDFHLNAFGYHAIRTPGRHCLTATLKIDGKSITSPPIEFDVVEVGESAVLAKHSIPLESLEGKKVPAEQLWPVIQQVKIGNRILLLYRLSHTPTGNVVSRTVRLTELPGKCEMSVSGAYGDGKPLTIAYKLSATAAATKLVINSVDGMIWTEEEERELQERNEQRIAPLPRLVNPTD